MAHIKKIEIRKRFLEKRARIAAPVRARDSAIIRQRLFQLPAWREAGTVLTYVSFRSEVETHKLIQETLDQGKRVVVPLIDVHNHTLTLSELHRLGDLAPGPYHGIYEPATLWRKPVDPSEVDLVLVPGTAFDRWGGRLGMGGGYFDKLLVQMPGARRIGLAFSSQVYGRRLPMDPRDVRMQTLITEKAVVEIPE